MGGSSSEMRAKPAELARALQRNEERGVGAGQVLGDAELCCDVLVQVGRTGRDGIPSAAPRAGLNDGCDVCHPSLAPCSLKACPGGGLPPPGPYGLRLAYPPPQLGQAAAVLVPTPD